MPMTPDRFPGEREEDGVLFDSTNVIVPSTNGEVRYVAGSGFKFYEEGVVKTLGGGSTAVTQEVCTCLSGDLAGNAVYITGVSVGGVLQVASCDPTNRAKMPAVGVILSKPTSTTALVCFSGIVVSPWSSSLTPGKTYFVSTAGVLATSATLGTIVQPVLIALDANRVKVIDGLPIVHARPTLSALSSYSTYINAPATNITLTGSGYDPQSDVYADGVLISSSYISPTQMQATIPTTVTAVAGTHTILVRNPTPIGGDSATQSYFIGAGILSLSPSTVVQYEPTLVLTVNGTGFTASSIIWVAGLGRTTTYVSSTQLTCPLPAAGAANTVHDVPASYDVQVKEPTIGDSNIFSYVVTRDTDVVLWHRGDLNVFPTDGSNIQTWGDSSGIGDTNKNLLQATVSRRASYVAADATYNNKPTVNFANGTGMYCSGTWSSPLNGAFTIYTAGDTATNVPAYLFSSVTLGTMAGPKYAVYGWTGAFWANYCDQTQTRITTTSSSTGPSLVCSVFNGASSAIYVNRYSTATATGAHGVESLFDHCIGAAYQYSNALRGPIAEILVTKVANTAAQRQRYMTYLSNRYALTITA